MAACVGVVTGFLDWIGMVLPEGCAVLLAIGVSLYFLGRLGLALHLIPPPRKDGRDSERERWNVR
jgi:hypothetical protein